MCSGSEQPPGCGHSAVGSSQQAALGRWSEPQDGRARADGAGEHARQPCRSPAHREPTVRGLRLPDPSRRRRRPVAPSTGRREADRAQRASGGSAGGRRCSSARQRGRPSGSRGIAATAARGAGQTSPQVVQVRALMTSIVAFETPGLRGGAVAERRPRLQTRRLVSGDDAAAGHLGAGEHAVRRHRQGACAPERPVSPRALGRAAVPPTLAFPGGRVRPRRGRRSSSTTTRCSTRNERSCPRSTCAAAGPLARRAPARWPPCARRAEPRAPARARSRRVRSKRSPC